MKYLFILQSAKNADKWNAAITPETRRRFFAEEDDDDEEAKLDDSLNDPDWRKTPIYRRLQSMKAETKVNN